MPNKLLLSLAICLLANITNAQTWRMGILALNDGEHIVGEIKFDFYDNSVQIRYDNKTLAYSAFQFYTFRLVKNDMFPERNFYVLDYAENGAERATPHIFEGIVKGEISLLTRGYSVLAKDYVLPEEPLVKFRMPLSWAGTGAITNESFLTDAERRNARTSISYPKTKYELFLAWSDGRVVDLKGSKKDRIDAFGDKKRKLNKYVKRYDLNLYNRFHIARLVKYYNELSNSSDTKKANSL